MSNKIDELLKHAETFVLETCCDDEIDKLAEIEFEEDLGDEFNETCAMILIRMLKVKNGVDNPEDPRDQKHKWYLENLL